MSRCCICNYSDYGLSDIPLDGRTITDDVCSKCSKEISQEAGSDVATVGWLLSGDDPLSVPDDCYGVGGPGVPEPMDGLSDRSSTLADSNWVDPGSDELPPENEPGLTIDSRMPPEAPNLTAEWGLGEGQLPI